MSSHKLEASSPQNGSSIPESIQRETWPSYSIPSELKVQLDRADEFIKDYAAGCVDRGVNALALLLKHAHAYEPGEIVEQDHRGGKKT